MAVSFIDCLYGSGREGGADIATLELARYLDQAGIKTEILSFQHGIQLAMPHPLKTKPLIRELAAFPLAGKKAMRAAQGSCDLIHINSLALAPLYRPHCPTVITVHNIQTQRFEAYMRKGRFPLVYNPVTCIPFKRMEQKAVKNIDHFIAITKDIADFLQYRLGVPEASISSIPNGVDTELFRPTTQKSSRVIFVGRATLPKGFDTLIQAAPMIKAPVLAVISKIRKATASKASAIGIELKSRVAHEELAPLVAQSSLLVLPSWDEQQSLVVLEAMACGLPVVTTPAGASDLIKDGENGIVVPPHDPGALADAVNHLLGNRDEAEAHGARNRRKAEEGYSWSKVSKEVLGIYSDLLSR